MNVLNTLELSKKVKFIVNKDGEMCIRDRSCTFKIKQHLIFKNKK